MDAAFFGRKRGAPRADYHDDMLVVRVRDAAAPALFAHGARTGSGRSPGLDALAFHERAGAIKQVTPLARRRKPAADALPKTAARLFSAAAAGGASEPAHRRGSIVELHPGHDLRALKRALESDPSIESVARVPVRRLMMAAPKKKGGPYRAIPKAKLWNLPKIRWAEARALPGFEEATKVNVAVLDTGVDVGHPDLAGRIARYVHRYSGVKPAASAQDLVGHGTHVSGVIGALIGNGIGIDGVCACRLHVYKIFADEPTYDASLGGFAYDVDPTMYRRALADCIDDGIDAINLSIGGGAPPDPQETLLYAELLRRDVTIVASIGNDRSAGSPTMYPAAVKGVIAVGSTGRTDRVSAFSNAGSYLALCAPGEAIWSTMPTYPGQAGFYPKPGPGKPQIGKPYRRATNYTDMNGTSMASPQVAAAVALLRAKKGKLSAAAVRKALAAGVDRPKAMGTAKRDKNYGYGRLNLAKLLG